MKQSKPALEKYPLFHLWLHTLVFWCRGMANKRKDWVKKDEDIRWGWCSAAGLRRWRKNVTLIINGLYCNCKLLCVCNSTCILGKLIMVIHGRSNQNQNSVPSCWLSMVACTDSVYFEVISHLTFLKTKLCTFIPFIWA